MKVLWEIAREERYCVDSGWPVHVAGDRCLAHGNAFLACYTSTRDPRCEHPRLSKNHPFPKCEDCGLTGEWLKEE